jgi:EmrB/QacA subfamily drug resistance transporter
MYKLKDIPLHYQIAIIYTLILFLDRIDLTIVNVAIPTLSKLFNIDIALTDWLSTSFLIGLSISIGISSWLGESYGYKKIFISSIFGFAFFSLACSFSSTFYQFVFSRFLQGLCGGIIIPTGNAILYMSCEKNDYAKVTNFAFLPTLLAPAIAPYLGGIIMKYYSYQAIFFINLPICLIIGILGWIIIKEQHKFEKEKLDFLGFVVSSFTYIFFFTALSYISKTNFIYASYLMVVSLLLGYALIKIEKNKEHPLINFKYFKNDFFLKATLIQLFFQMSHFGSFFIIGLYLQIGLGFTPVQAGLIIAMQALGAIIVTIPSKHIFYKKGAIFPIAGGLIGISIITPLILLISSNSQIIPACIIMLARGLFSGWVGTPLHTISMFDSNISKKDIGRIGSMFNIARQLSISLGVGISAVLIGVTNGFYKFNYTNQVLGYCNSVKLFCIGILSVSIFCLIGAYFAFKLNNQKIIQVLIR